MTLCRHGASRVPERHAGVPESIFNGYGMFGVLGTVSLARWVQVPAMLSEFGLVERQSLRVRVPRMRSPDLAYSWHCNASLTLADSGVVLGSLPRGNPYPWDQRPSVTEAVGHRVLRHGMASPTPTAQGDGQ